MVTNAQPAHPDQNRIIASLPVDEYLRVAKDLGSIDLVQGKVLYDFGAEIQDVFFPTRGMVSLLSISEGGSLVEVAMVGNEGMLGAPIALGFKTSPHQVIVQVQGAALRIKAVVLRSEFERNGVLQHLLLRHVGALLAEISQSVVCNRFHMVEQRLCRWLLVTSDRVRSNSFSLTQEFLSYMLGSRREGVTVAMGDLKRLGLIHHARGQITIVDRDGLERASCECYHIVRDAYTQTLGV